MVTVFGLDFLLVY